jgi:hypothetical protein
MDAPSMREVYRNPILYYLLIPLLVALWPLLVWGVYLPRNEHQQDIEESLLVEGQDNIIDILRIDPDRLKIIDVNEVTEEFAFGRATDRAANLCAIPSSSCSYSGGGIMKVSGKRRQEGRIKLAGVSMFQAAKFLSTLQAQWATLTCEQAILTKKKGMPDQWDVDFTFVYYY